jgi:hypothetical protein
MKSKLLCACFLLNYFLLTKSSFKIGLINDFNEEYGLQSYTLKAMQYFKSIMKTSKKSWYLTNHEIKVSDSRELLNKSIYTSITQICS